MHGDSHVINIVRKAEVNSSWFPDLGDQPITVNYRFKKIRKRRRSNRRPRNYSYLDAAQSSSLQQ